MTTSTSTNDVDVTMPHVFGLDLGSQRCVAAAQSGDVVLNELGGMTTATLVSFKGDERLIGEAAVLSSSTNPTNTIDALNVLLGQDVATIHTRLATVPGQHATFSQHATVAYGTGAVAQVEYIPTKGSEATMAQFTTEQLMGMLLSKMAQQMRKRVGSPTDDIHVHVAVPSGWTGKETHALQIAAKIAGIPRISVVSRDEALAMCYHRKHPMGPESDPAERHIVIMDMGHTSTSVAVVKLTPEGPTVLASACDLALGSENFDLHLYGHFKHEIETTLGLALNHNGKEGKRLLQSCEKLKKLLSTIGDATVTVENIAQDRDYTLKTTRDVFERLCAKESERITTLLAQVLASAQVEATSISSVEIVGGGTRIPFVQSAILSAFGSQDTSLIGRMLDSTTSIAVGAALHEGSDNDEVVFTPEESAAIEKLVALEVEMQARDADLAAIAHERNAIEAFVYEMRSKRDTKHSDKIDYAALNPLLEAAEDWIYSEESENATLESIRAKHAEIRSNIQATCHAYFAAIDQDERAFEAHLDEEARKAEEERAAEGGDDHDTRKLKKPERMRLVTKNKDEGNELFRDGNHQHAAMRYIKALSHSAKFFDLNQQETDEVNKVKLSLYLNLAQCYIKMEQWSKVIANCRDALAIDAANPKALYRRAFAYEKEKKIDEAAADLKLALQYAPEDKAIQKLDERVKTILKRQLDKEKKMWGRAFA